TTLFRSLYSSFCAKFFAGFAFWAFTDNNQLCWNFFLNTVKHFNYIFYPFYFPKITNVGNDPFVPISHHIALAVGKCVYFLWDVYKIWDNVNFLSYVKKMQCIFL